MKIKTISILFVITLLSFQQLTAQSLSKRIQKNIEELTEQFASLSEEKITALDQVAFSIFKKIEGDKTVGVLVIDQDNTTDSQLAMIWLQTGFMYYDLNIGVESAGIKKSVESLSKIRSLTPYGFRVKNAPNGVMYNYLVDYGKGDEWVVFSKGLHEIDGMGEDPYRLYVEKVEDAYPPKAELFFEHIKNIPLEMVYIATQLDHIIKINQ